MLKPYSEIHLSGSPRVRHTNVRQFEEHIKPYLSTVAGINGIETVCLVREPVSWLNSWYRFRARHQLRDGHHPYSTAHVSFEEFVRGYLASPRPSFAEVGTQFDFVRDAGGELGVDRLFAYDDIKAVVAYFSNRIGKRLKIRALNVSPDRVYSSNAVERIDALKRRLLHLLPGRVQPGSAPASPPAELPPDLLDALRSVIPKDFWLYENFT